MKSIQSLILESGIPSKITKQKTNKIKKKKIRISLVIIMIQNQVRILKKMNIFRIILLDISWTKKEINMI